MKATSFSMKPGASPSGGGGSRWANKYTKKEGKRYLQGRGSAEIERMGNIGGEFLILKAHDRRRYLFPHQ